MRCTICNALLDDFESTRKYPKHHPKEGEYLDICTPCLVEVMDLTEFSPDVKPSELLDDSPYFIDKFD